MRNQPVQQMVRILPHGPRRRISGARGIDVGKHPHPFLLGPDEAVLLIGLVSMGPDEFVAQPGDGTSQNACSISSWAAQHF